LTNLKKSLTIITADREPGLFDKARRLVGESFPEFMNHSEIISRYWQYLYLYWSDWQFLLADKNSKIHALANCFPLRYEGSLDYLPDGGIEWALETAINQREKGIAPNIACAFQIVVAKSSLGKGLSYLAVEEMIDLATRREMIWLIAPVRPNRKAEFPDMPIEEYVVRRREDGLPFDDWIRVHVRMGGRLLNVCRRSFVVDTDLENWRLWTGLALEDDGPQIIDGALAPVIISLDNKRGIYAEPNIWIKHRASR